MVGGSTLILLSITLETLRFPLAGESITPDFLVGPGTSLPFVLLLGYGGYWLQHGPVPPARHRRVGLWALGGAAVFLAINLVIMPFYPRPRFYEHYAWVRWALSLGGGTGVLIGLFEARAIDRELAAERTRLRNEELADQKDRLEDFAAILSHDLRNPLNVATGNIDLARREHESDRLDAAARALSRMDEIIEETLLLARSGLVIGETEPVDLDVLARACWRSVDTRDATLDVDDPPTVSGDTDRLRHLLENLFRNSVEHGSTNPRSHARETGGEHGSSGNRDAVRLDDAVEHAGSATTIRVGSSPGGFFVEDDGPGIPEANRELVFDAGFSTASDGNGFGLAIVQQIADAHGWTVSVAESETGGARFEFTGVETLD